MGATTGVTATTATDYTVGTTTSVTPKTSSLSSQDSFTQGGSSRGSISSTTAIVSGYSSMSSMSAASSAALSDNKPSSIGGGNSSILASGPITMTGTTVTSYERTGSITGATPRTNTSSFDSTTSSSAATGGTVRSYLPSSVAVTSVPTSSVLEDIKRHDRPLSRTNSTDAELIFGDKPADFYRSKYAYSGYTSQGRGSVSDTDATFGKSVDSYKSNTNSFSISGDSDFGSSSRDKDFSDRARLFEGIENPVFQDYNSPVTKTSSSKPRWAHDDDDDYDLK